MQTLNLIIRDIQQATPLVRTFVLENSDGGVLPAFEPGAHLKVQIPGLAEPRCYSLIATCADTSAFAAPRQYRLGVRLDEAGGGGSRYMHGLAIGDTLTVQGPKNDFPLHACSSQESAERHRTVLIAGGIGITPIASMAAALKHADREFVLHYCGRSRDQLALVEELHTLAGDGLNVHVDDDPLSALNVGALLDTYAPHQHLYVCGPQGMIDAVIAGARQRQWPDTHIHFELFTTAAPLAGDQPFEVELKQSGMVLTIPADKTILEVMEEAGCDPMYDCKRGECGVCQATVLEGTPDHRDYYLSDAEKAEGKLIQICISRAKSERLVLDL